MFSEFLKRIENQYSNKLPFVVYRKPKDEIVKAVFQKDTQVHDVKNYTETGFVFAPFDSNDSSVLLLCDEILEAKYTTEKPVETTDKTFVNSDDSRKEFHINLVEKGIRKIEKGEFQKVVVSRKAEIACETEPLKLFQNLLDSYSNAFCYLWHHPEIGTWLGATPEILLKSENQRFTTMSLAGTMKYFENKNPEWGNKELKEQQLVTDYISKALENLVSNLEIGSREPVRAGNLWHLRTKLTGRVDQGSLAGIISALHPTPAVCGMPMNIAKNFILANEGYNREFYTGFLGELNFKTEQDRTSNSRNQENKAYRSVKNTTTLFVNLRCMQLKESRAHIYMGGGVTQDSNAEKEWEETIAKSKTILQVLGV